jgi:tocopherol cyclase
VSFAFIISIEDPGIKKSDLRLSCIQVVGPSDGYLVQADCDDTKFWAWKHEQGLGCNFEYHVKTSKLTTALSPEEWRTRVKSGFQVLPTRLQGRIHGHNGSRGGVLDGQEVSGHCEFDMTIDLLCGWGDSEQKSTAGWLASFSGFEPHWQVTLADARAAGHVTWRNTTFEFEDAPFYAKKNWGAALPTKWYWMQCNLFEGHSAPGEPHLSVTAGGGVRQTPLGKESLGMISVHYNGTFYKAIPWTGIMEWEVKTWGSWTLKGNCAMGDRPFSVEFTCKVDPQTTPGLVFRAPTPDEGMVYFCRDTFEADSVLSLWELVWDEASKAYVRRDAPPIIDAARSSQGGAEVGGGPWWDTWKRVSDMRQPMKALVQLPYRIDRLRRKLSWRRRKTI